MDDVHRVRHIDKLACPSWLVYHGPVTSDSEPVDLGILLALAYQGFVRELRAALAQQGFQDLGRSDGYVFRALGQRPMTVSDLAARLEISKQGAGQIIDDMERRGYIQRRPDPGDGRSRLLYLSPRGSAALAAAHDLHQRYEERLIRRHGREAVLLLREVVTTMSGGEPEIQDPHLRALYL
jgi:DNA-binding MarR family transcriptional regulator